MRLQARSGDARRAPQMKTGSQGAWEPAFHLAVMALTLRGIISEAPGTASDGIIGHLRGDDQRSTRVCGSQLQLFRVSAQLRGSGGCDEAGRRSAYSGGGHERSRQGASSNGARLAKTWRSTRWRTPPQCRLEAKSHNAAQVERD